MSRVCPKCDCDEIKILRHPEVEYPEIWNEYKCKDCGWLIGLVDNSPYISCFEFEDFVIDI